LALPAVSTWSMGCAIALLGAASYTDLRWRRIPNYLTFPGFGLGLILYLATGGWIGLLLGVSGALLAPSLLSLAHGGKGLGMGDIKLAIALGALLGPILGAVAMVLSMIAGAGVALFWMAKEWGMFGHGRVHSGITAVLGRNRKGGAAEGGVSKLAVPYGLAIAIGTLFTLVVSLWTGKQDWFLWFVTGMGTP
jgi:prepilin peptidase CpaA